MAKHVCPRCHRLLNELKPEELESGTLGYELYYKEDVRLYCAACAVETGVLTSYKLADDKQKEETEREEGTEE